MTVEYGISLLSASLTRLHNTSILPQKYPFLYFLTITTETPLYYMFLIRIKSERKIEIGEKLVVRITAYHYHLLQDVLQEKPT